MEEKEILWKQYEQHINTYKFYLEIVVKLMVMYFAVCGAMLSFYFTKTDIENAKYALYLPLVMSFGLFFFFAVAARLSIVTSEDVFDLRDKLMLDVLPELGVLTFLLVIFSVVTLLCFLGLGFILWS